PPFTPSRAPFFFSPSSPFFFPAAPPASSRPDRRIVAGRRAQMLSRLAASSAATPSRASAFTAIEHDGRLDGSGVAYTPVCYLSVSSVSAHYSDNGCLLFFGRPCYEVHGACDDRINLYPAAPIRLAKVLLAWTIVQEGWDSSLERQSGKSRSAKPPTRHTSAPPDPPDWGVGTQRRVDVIA